MPTNCGVAVSTFPRWLTRTTPTGAFRTPDCAVSDCAIGSSHLRLQMRRGAACDGRTGEVPPCASPGDAREGQTHDDDAPGKRLPSALPSLDASPSLVAGFRICRVVETLIAGRKPRAQSAKQFETDLGSRHTACPAGNQQDDFQHRAGMPLLLPIKTAMFSQ